MFWVEPFKRGWQNTALWQISGVSLERNGSESLKLRSGSLYFQHGRGQSVYSLLSQGTDQRWNKVWQVKMNSQCQNDEIKLLIVLFCLSVVSLLSIAVQWNSVVSTWRFSFILMQRLETTVFHVCGLLVGDISFVTICTFWKLALITLNSLWNNFGNVLMIEICSVLSGSGCWRMWYTIYENRPHRRHFTVHCLQWSITFLTEYIMSLLSMYVKFNQNIKFKNKI